MLARFMSGAPFAAIEIEMQLIPVWCGQGSDGWGESVEQRPIKIPDGELYVSFWNNSNDFFIKTEEELKGSPLFSFGMFMN